MKTKVFGKAMFQILFIFMSISCLMILIKKIKLYLKKKEKKVCSECGRSGVLTPVRSSQRLKNWHLLLPWLAFTI